MTLFFISIILTLLQYAKLYFIQLDDLREKNKGNDGSVEVSHWSRLSDQIWHQNSKYTPRTQHKWRNQIPSSVSQPKPEGAEFPSPTGRHGFYFYLEGSSALNRKCRAE